MRNTVNNSAKLKTQMIYTYVKAAELIETRINNPVLIKTVNNFLF